MESFTATVAPGSNAVNQATESYGVWEQTAAITIARSTAYTVYMHSIKTCTTCTCRYLAVRLGLPVHVHTDVTGQHTRTALDQLLPASLAANVTSIKATHARHLSDAQQLLDLVRLPAAVCNTHKVVACVKSHMQRSFINLVSLAMVHCHSCSMDASCQVLRCHLTGQAILWLCVTACCGALSCACYEHDHLSMFILA